MKKILNEVSSYIKTKNANKKWNAGIDWVKYSGPYFTEDEYLAAIESILNGWLVLGEDAIKFENQFPQHLGKKYGILTNSGSSANLLMMMALTSNKLNDFPRGTKVITPVAGFPTTVNPILQAGFTPVFVDIELNTLNIDLDDLEKTLKLYPDIEILTFAHVLGNPPNMDRVMHLVKKYDLIFLEDCCDALNSTYDGKLLGGFGDMASCSFYPAHHITFGEGGFVAMNDYNQEKVIRSLREWGRGCYCVGEKANLLKNGTCKCRFSNWLSELPNEIFDHKYVYEEIGYNLKPIELQASIGLQQLKKLNEITVLRKRNFSELHKIFMKYEEYFIIPKATEKSDPNWFAFPLTIKTGAPFNRWNICNYLEEHKIQTRQYFGGNLLLQPAYNRFYIGDALNDFKNATKCTTNTFFLGTSPIITLEQIKYIEYVVDKFFSEKVNNVIV